MLAGISTFLRCIVRSALVYLFFDKDCFRLDERVLRLNLRAFADGCGWMVLQVRLSFDEPEPGITIVKLIHSDVPEEDRLVSILPSCNIPKNKKGLDIWIPYSLAKFLKGSIRFGTTINLLTRTEVLK